MENKIEKVPTDWFMELPVDTPIIISKTGDGRFGYQLLSHPQSEGEEELRKEIEKQLQMNVDTLGQDKCSGLLITL